MFDFSEPLFWITIGIFLLIIEFVGAGALYAIIFGIGAFATSILAFFIDDVLLLTGAFIGFSLIALILIKPFLEKVFKVNKTKENISINSIVASKGTVIEEITKHEKGVVTINHEEWTAATTTEDTLVKDSVVIVEKVEGATAFVRLLKEGE